MVILTLNEKKPRLILDTFKLLHFKAVKSPVPASRKSLRGILHLSVFKYIRTHATAETLVICCCNFPSNLQIKKYIYSKDGGAKNKE